MAIRVPSRTKQRRYGYVRVPEVVPEPPACPLLLSPSDGGTLETQTTATLEWGNVTGSIYNIYIWATSDPEPASPVDTTSLTEYAASSLSASTSYFWKITSVSNGLESVGCETRTFTTAAEEQGALCDDLPGINAILAGDFSYNEPIGDEFLPAGWNNPAAVQDGTITIVAESGSVTCPIPAGARYKAIEDQERIPRSGSTLTITYSANENPATDSAYHYDIVILVQEANSTATNITLQIEVASSIVASVVMNVPLANVSGGLLRSAKAVLIKYLVAQGEVLPSEVTLTKIAGDYIANNTYPFTAD